MQVISVFVFLVLSLCFSLMLERCTEDKLCCEHKIREVFLDYSRQEGEGNTVEPLITDTLINEHLQ
jgi:hypothetical protein